MDCLEFYRSILKAVGALLINFCVGIERNSTMLREHTLDDFNPLKYTVLASAAHILKLERY